MCWKITKSFSIKIGIYRNMSVQNCPVFTHFRPVTFCSRDQVPPISVCYTPSGFWVIGELINFKAQHRHFLCFFCVSIHDQVTYSRIHESGTHDAFINSHVKSKFQLSKFNRLLVMSKSILLRQNSQRKPKGTTRSREVLETFSVVLSSAHNGPDMVRTSQCLWFENIISKGCSFFFNFQQN